MLKKELILLVEVVDELLRLDVAIKNLGGLSYQEQFCHLDNVYEIIKGNSIFANCVNEEQEMMFYNIVEELSETPEKRVERLISQQDT